MSIIKKARQLKSKNPGSLILIRVGDFYEAFEDDAVTLSNTVGLTLTKRTHKDTSVAMAGFPYHQLDSCLQKLITSGQRVAIADS